ncbi:c-type cytochrome [Acanthopleuribacter pedis]|uniref:C-type cytochrome n=1 Tax=Acanthopleuribacter pedis TaxID=442870 RepID=A0A8J7QP18_9BACT|nr:c-type cytochrome [Acanthopleuribacter pedis]MBO1322640.1 c-type cytochrome [Acanthopleuribacter pedis]
MSDNSYRRVYARRLTRLPLLAAVFFLGCGRIDPGQLPEPPAFAEAPATWAALQGDVASGKRAAKQYCLGCHVVDGEGHQLSTAPSFEAAMNQPHVAPLYLRRWLWNPPAVKPETIMPNLSLDPAVIEDLTAFLATYREVSPAEEPASEVETSGPQPEKTETVDSSQ